MTIDSDVQVQAQASLKISRTESTRRTRPSDGPASLGFKHIELGNLTPEVESLLSSAEGSWLASYGFSTLYAFPPAMDAWVKADEQAHAINACYFVERPWKGPLKTLHIFGPTNLGIHEIQRLLLERKAAFATITCMGPEDVAQLPGRWYHCVSAVVNEDIVLELPSSEDEYLRSLGQNARTQLPYYLRRVQKEWGKENSLFYATGSEITLPLFTELVELNRDRIERKGARHLWHPQLIKQRWQLAQESGLFCGLRRGETLVAGTLSYLHRDEAYFVLIGHQAQYDRLRLGKLVLWATIKHLINLGYSRYHLLWGKSAYKFQLGGQPKDLSEVTVFRHAGTAILWHSERFIHQLVGGVKWLRKIPRFLWSRIGPRKAAV